MFKRNCNKVIEFQIDKKVANIMRLGLRGNLYITDDEKGQTERDLEFNINAETHDHVSYEHFKEVLVTAGQCISHIFDDYKEE